MKTQTTASVLAVLMILGSVSVSLARPNKDLVNNALNQTLSERARIEKTYEKRVARPSSDPRKQRERIEVVMTGEIGGRNGKLRNHDSSSRVYREHDVQSKLDREAAEIDQGFTNRVEKDEVINRIERSERGPRL